MATKRTSFLKRQKELRRTERALDKREARRARKEAKLVQQHDSPAIGPSAEETSIDHNTEP
jgi:hypothetical protein